MPDDTVYVPVPKQFLSSIYGKLAELMGGSGTTIGTEVRPQLDDQMVRRIYDDSLEPHRRLMRLMAVHPDEWRYSGEIAADLELENGARGLAGMLGAYGRRAKHRYGGLKPWESQWDSAREEMRHMMPGSVAEVIRTIGEHS